MSPTNRPITSLEDKLMLNTEYFRDRKAGTELFHQEPELTAMRFRRLGEMA